MWMFLEIQAENSLFYSLMQSSPPCFVKGRVIFKSGCLVGVFPGKFQKISHPYSFSDIRCWCVERLELWFQAPFIPLVLFRKIFIPLKFSINCLRKWKLEIPTAVKNNVAGIFPGMKVEFFNRGNVSQNGYSSFTRYRRGRRKESGQQSISKTYRALVAQNEFTGFGLWIRPSIFYLRARRTANFPLRYRVKEL